MIFGREEFHRQRTARRILPEVGAALAAIGVGLLAVQGLTGLRSDLWRPLLWGVPAAMIVAGAVALEPVRAIRPPRALLGLGDASYAIYLCHFITVAVAARLVGGAPVWLFVSAAVALSLTAGLIVHRWIERPLIAACRAAPHFLASRALRNAAARS